MNENEIIKALECCGGDSAVDCDDCPLRRGELTHCTTELATNALDLINRQRGELRKKQIKIYKLLKELNQVQDYYEISKAENEELKCRNQNLTSLIERLTGSRDTDSMDFCGVLCKYAEGLIAEAKTEANNEFAKRLKCGVPQETGVIRCKDVDFTLTELTGQ